MNASVAGYVLAGGKSSRMGRDKALLELGGRRLIARAVSTLREVCAEVHILSDRPELAEYAPLLADIHPGCGPLGGIEVALRSTASAWNLFLPVDMPFVAASLLVEWAQAVLAREREGARISILRGDGRVHPTLCLLHRDVSPFVESALPSGAFKVSAALESAGKELARRQNVSVDQVLVIHDGGAGPEPGWSANVNTPEEFAAAEGRFRGLVRAS